jgi:hypothetical protein
MPFGMKRLDNPIAPSPLVASWLGPAILLATLLVFCTLYLTARSSYEKCIELWGFAPYPRVFFDTEYISNLITCWGRGVDVYRVNPCDPLGRLHDYSPLLLRFSLINTMPARALGLLQDIAFSCATAFLPTVHGRRDGLVFAAALLSPTTMFALERSNIDLSMVVLAIVGLACLERSWLVRLVGYSVFLFATLLKFYPVVLFASALNEQPRRSVWIAATAGAVLGAFFIEYYHEIRLALHNVPRPSAFGDGFSSNQLSNGVAFLDETPSLRLPIWLFMITASVAFAMHQASNDAFQRALDSLSPRSFMTMTAGALLFCGCFIAGPSVGYRGVLLLLFLPGAMAVARSTSERRLKLLMRLTIVAMLLAMWNIALMRRLIPTSTIGKAMGGGPMIAAWFAREILWWIVFSMLLATILHFISRSEAARRARSSLIKSR